MNTSRLARLAAVTACFSLAASPALADRGWGGGWRHHDDGIDAGDILGGLLVIGAIAAVASAASKSSKQRDGEEYRYPDNRPPMDDGRPGDEYSRSSAQTRDWGRSQSLNAAVNTCTGEIERGSVRVDTVDGVNRDGDGWRVFGRVRSGAPFTCTVGADGRVLGMSVDGHAPVRN